MLEPIALVALALDALVGWPGSLYARIGHPVGLFARLIGWCDRHWNDPARSNGARRWRGVATLVLLIAVVGGVCACLQGLAMQLPWPLGVLVIALASWPALAQRSLYAHVRDVMVPLGQGECEVARRCVGRIVGRDTAGLDAPGIARAAIESLAESFCDGIAAPLFWLLIGGLPGVWIYKAVNTADSMIGHKETPYTHFGWAAARCDDALNFLPARLGGALICLAGAGGWRIMWRYAARHASPNAGWTEAAMAGVLGLRLAGPVSYEGTVSCKAWIGEGRNEANAADIRRGLRVYVRACLGLWVIAGLFAWGGLSWRP